MRRPAACRGLRARILLPLGGILLVFAAAASTLLILNTRDRELQALERTGERLARYATARIYEAYAARHRLDGREDPAGLSRMTRDVLGLNPAVLGFRLLDPSGRILYDSLHPDAESSRGTDPEVRARLGARHAGAHADAAPLQVYRTRRAGTEVLEVLHGHSLGGAPVAVAVYDLSLAGLRREVVTTSVAMLLGTLLFFLLLGVALSYIVSRTVLRPMTLIAAAAQALGQGYLDARAAGGGGSAEMDALARALDTMAGELKGTVAKLSALGEEVSAASGAILAHGGEVAQGTQEQATETRRTDAALEQMTTSAHQGLMRATQVADLGESVKSSFGEMTMTTEQIAASARSLGAYVDRTHDSIMEINGSVGAVSRSAESLSVLSDQAVHSLASLHTSIRRVRDQAEQSRAHSQSAHSQAASLGAATVEQAVAGVDRLREIIDRAVGIIEGLSRRSTEVGRIATLIDEVTDRTNLLGINASIMAAQAGEHGAGFAVVAEEIKSLSLQIGGSTRDINRVLASMREEAGAAVRVIREGSESAAESVKLSEGVREALARIVEHAGETSRMLADIAAATDGQEEDTRALKGLAEKVAAMAGETADATRSQKAFSSRIVDATDGMRTLAEQVSRSTGEHSRNARQVASALRELGEGIEAIAGAVRLQIAQAEPVRTSLHAIRVLADSNMARAEVMSETVTALALRADTLRAELDRFRFRGAPRFVQPEVAAAGQQHPQDAALDQDASSTSHATGRQGARRASPNGSAGEDPLAPVMDNPAAHQR